MARDPARHGPEPAAAPAALLDELTVAVAAGVEREPVFAQVLEALVRLAGARAGVIFRLDDDGPGRTPIAHCGPQARLDAEAAERAVEPAIATLELAPAPDAPALAVALDFGDGPAPALLALEALRAVVGLVGMVVDGARAGHESQREALERERLAIAAELHDALGQALAFIKMRLPLLHDAMRGRGGTSAAAEGYFQDVRRSVGQAHAALRGLLTQFRAPMHPLGLVPALRAAVKDFGHRGPVHLSLAIEVPELQLAQLGHLAPEAETQVFHVVQEALSNVARHAGARRAWVRITTQAAEGGKDRLVVDIEDDGVGPPNATAEADKGSHYGMDIMRERAARLAGTLEVGARPGGGTRVRLAFPWPAAPAGPGGAG